MSQPDSTPDSKLREILTRSKTIALVGASLNPERASHKVGLFLRDKGYRVIPVNPGHGGETLFGETVCASLADIPDPIDMVDVFRRADAVPEILEQTLRHHPEARTLWLQLGITHETSAQKAREAGFDVVQNRCPKIEHPRLFPAP